MDKKKLIDLTKNLRRNVRIHKNHIEVVSDKVLGIKYAYYLEYKGQVEKYHYTDNTKHLFGMNLIPGVYKATFFYKSGENRVSYTIRFFLQKNNNIKILKYFNIIEKDDYKIDFYGLDSNITFITFNGIRTTKKSVPFGLDYLLGKGFNVISCLQNNDQYQGLSLDDFKRVIAPLVENHNVFLYGSSLGGYCAIYYAGTVNGTVISAAPKNSAHPLLIERRKSKLYDIKNFKHINIMESDKTTKSVFIFYDPEAKQDVFFINKLILPYNGKVNLIPIRYGGHAVLYHMNKTGQLDSVINDIVNGIKPTYDQSIQSSYSYINMAIHYIRDEKYDKAVFLIEKALKDKEIDNKVRKEWEALLLDSKKCSMYQN